MAYGYILLIEKLTARGYIQHDWTHTVMPAKHA